MRSRLIFVCVLLLIGSSHPAITTGQEKNGEKGETKATEQIVERKYNRFNNKTTVTLRRQRILDRKSPRQILEMSGETTFRGETPTGPTDTIQLVFTLAASDSPYTNTVELNFIVDETPVRGSRSGVGSSYEPPIPLAPDLHVARDIRAFVSPDVIRTVANGKKVEMQLGTIELALDAATLSSLRKFSSAIFNK